MGNSNIFQSPFDSNISSSSGIAIESFLVNQPSLIHSSTSRNVSTDPKKQFFCHECNASFFSGSGLWKHNNRMHLNRTTYVCQYCGKGYFDRCRYDGHLLNAHETVKSHKCLSCPCVFADRLKLDSHMHNKHSHVKIGETENFL